MSIRMAPASIFRASALSTFDASTGANAPWLEEGVHLRAKVHPWIGFPIHPFAAWRLDLTDEWREVQIFWRDRAGRTLWPPFDLESIDGVAFGTLVGATRDDPWVWLDLDVDNRGARIDLLESRAQAGGEAPVVATRHDRPFRFGHTEIAHLRASGAGSILPQARGVRISDLFIDQIRERQPDLIFGLPLPEVAPDGAPLAPGPWFAPDPNIRPVDAAAMRVSNAAPRRLSPPDNPTGSTPDGTDPNDEANRILGAIAPELIDPWLFRAFGDPNIAPVHAVHEEPAVTDKAQPLTARSPITPALLTMAVDPQIARYLGLATSVRYEETAPMQMMNVWVIAGRWAVQRDRIVHRYRDLFGLTLTLDTMLGPAQSLAAIDATLDATFPDAEPIISDLPNRPDPDRSGLWSVETLLAVAVAAGEAPPDPPDPFTPGAYEPGAWNAHDDPLNPGPERWRQQISLGQQPARGMVGFTRMSPEEPIALHRMAPPPDLGFVSRALPLVPNWASNNQRLVTDREIPPHAAGASWQIWHADEFGQWSEPASLALPLPARPTPPPPLPEATYHAHPADGSSAPRVPGVIHLRYEVPALEHAAPGSLPIVELRITVDGQPLPDLAVSPGEVVTLDAEPRPFGVGEYRDVPIESFYVDSDGVVSPPPVGPFVCPAFDARAPVFIPTSPVVIWSGQPDATGQSELMLRWPPRAGAARYRIYLGDARRLAGALSIALPASPVRSAQAKPIHDASGGLASRADFTFLGEVPGVAAGDGKIHFRTLIPGGLRSVQFIRIVPLTQGGAEAGFSICPLVPIAVPATDRAPAPFLDAATDPVSGLTLTISARGLRDDLLAAVPGGVPEFRLRRTRRTSAERADIPVWRSGTLTSDGHGTWTATVAVPANELDPFVRMNWIADVRYPAEPPLPPGFIAEPVAGGVEPIWSTIGAPSEGIWSFPSLVAESLLIPPAGPDAVLPPTITAEPDGSRTLEFTGLPVAHAAAIAPYRLEIYHGLAGEPSVLVDAQDVTAQTRTWTNPAPVLLGEHYAFVLIDPIGRRSSPTRA